jgi:hypothetical protein
MIPLNLKNAVEMAKAIANGEFRLLCPSMCLAPTRSNNPEDAELKGIGTIETTPRGGLRYRMAFDQALPPSHWHDMKTPPAHVESIHELYRLVAVDSAGREWRSAPVGDVSVRWSMYTAGGKSQNPSITSHIEIFTHVTTTRQSC